MARRAWWLAGVAVVLVVAGCGGVRYKGGTTPQPPEGGTRPYPIHVSSLDDLHGLTAELRPNGFKPTETAIRVGDPIRFRNVDSRPHTIETIKAPTEPFKKTLAPGTSLQRTYTRFGTVIVQMDGDPHKTFRIELYDN